MKKVLKILSLATILVILFSTAALAEDQFTLHNGITWKMSPEEVKELENGVNPQEEEHGRTTVLFYEADGDNASRKQLFHIFIDDHLIMTGFRINPDTGKIDASAMRTVMNLLYDRAEQANVREFLSCLLFVMPEMFTDAEAAELEDVEEMARLIDSMSDEELNQLMDGSENQLCKWEKDGTSIWMIIDDYQILGFCVDMSQL